MQTSSKETVQRGLDWATSNIQEIAASSQELFKKSDLIEIQLLMLLDDVVLALPQAMREQAQTCLATYEQVRKECMTQIDAHIAEWRARQEARLENLEESRNAQKEASPSSLQAVDSL
ncbi:MAG TPA: hypothetical protein VGD98_09840 [Ktedonobacteraceae bacterium]